MKKNTLKIGIASIVLALFAVTGIYSCSTGGGGATLDSAAKTIKVVQTINKIKGSESLYADMMKVYRMRMTKNDRQKVIDAHDSLVILLADITGKEDANKVKQYYNFIVKYDAAKPVLKTLQLKMTFDDASMTRSFLAKVDYVLKAIEDAKSKADKDKYMKMFLPILKTILISI